MQRVRTTPTQISNRRELRMRRSAVWGVDWGGPSMDEGGHRGGGEDGAVRLHSTTHIGCKTLMAGEVQLAEGVVDGGTRRLRRGVKREPRRVNPTATARYSTGTDNGTLRRAEQRIGLEKGGAPDGAQMKPNPKRLSVSQLDRVLPVSPEQNGS